jgi:hypothetical protein
VKSYLDDRQRKTKFRDNLPGYDWSVLFLKRHKKLSHRLVTSTKSERAKVTPDQISDFFNNAEAILKDVSPENVLNYDETAFVDSAGT